jgi:transposase-like protein
MQEPASLLVAAGANVLPPAEYFAIPRATVPAGGGYLPGPARRGRAAKAKGKLRGKQPKLNPRQKAHLVDLYRRGEHSTGELADLFGVARSTVYRALQRDQVQGAAQSPHSGRRRGHAALCSAVAVAGLSRRRSDRRRSRNPGAGQSQDCCGTTRPSPDRDRVDRGRFGIRDVAPGKVGCH